MYVVSFVGNVIAGAELSERYVPASGPLAGYLIALSLIAVFTGLFVLVVRRLHEETKWGEKGRWTQGVDQ